MCCKNKLVMRKVICLIFIALIIASCEEKETFKYYSFDFHPVVEVNNSDTWIETDFISGETLAFQLNSYRILEEFHDFEAIKFSTLELVMDKDFIINSDTIKSGENLLLNLDNDLISFSQRYKKDVEYNWYYLIIKRTDTKRINLASGYYQFNINGYTEHNYEISDSILIKYNNR